MYRDHGKFSVSLFLVSLREFHVFGPVVSVYLLGVVHRDHFLLVTDQR